MSDLRGRCTRTALVVLLEPSIGQFSASVSPASGITLVAATPDPDVAVKTTTDVVVSRILEFPLVQIQRLLRFLFLFFFFFYLYFFDISLLLTSRMNEKVISLTWSCWTQRKMNTSSSSSESTRGKNGLWVWKRKWNIPKMLAGFNVASSEEDHSACGR